MLNVSELCLLPDASLYAIRWDNGDEFLDLITENMSDIVFQIAFYLLYSCIFQTFFQRGLDIVKYPFHELLSFSSVLLYESPCMCEIIIFRI